MQDARLSTRGKNQHIQVFVRVRPTNDAEKRGKCTPIVEVPSNKEVVVHGRPQDRLSKKFTFNKVFGPLSQQIDVYNAVVSPLVEEVLAGYNCTVFAYGQTGTGKTFTMEGVGNDPTLQWQNDTTAGMIPRALSHLFEELRLLDAEEYTVRVSFLELYNEELFDLLSGGDDVSKIRLYEDTARKGAVIIHGLEEVTVHNQGEVHKILQMGSEKRQTAATLMNAQSSRSHTIFSVTVHTKENAVDGEELLKTGKLNLVDLAGSENVGRSGAVDRRAREAGNINQSLLTLGRVITALVERAPHIPYRESKLTRLLQESLGGRTKTSIIATVSPASSNLEETLSTLDYAHRAKNITNRPEINQKLSKKALLKEYSEEIERLRSDLLASRQKDGVYLAHDNYNEMQALIDSQSKEIEEKINNIKALEETIQDKEKICNELRMKHEFQASELKEAKNELYTVSHALKSTNQRLEITEHERDEHQYLVEQHASTEKALLSQAQILLSVADTATADTHRLHDKIARKTQVEQKNESLGQQFRDDIAQRFRDVEKDLVAYTEDIEQFCSRVKKQVDAQKISDGASMNLTNRHFNVANRLSKSINMSYEYFEEWVRTRVERTVGMTENEHQWLTSVFVKLAPKMYRLIENETANVLQSLNEHVAQKLQNVSVYVNDAISVACDSRLQDCERLRKNAREINEKVECILVNQKEVMKDQRAYAQVMEDLYKQYDLLRKAEEEHYAKTIGRFRSVNEACYTIKNQATEHRNKKVEMEKQFDNDIQRGIQGIRSNVARGTEKNAQLAILTTQRGWTLVDELQGTINAGCNTLKQYESQVERDAKEMREKMDGDKTEILSLIDGIHKVAVDASKVQADFTAVRRIEISNRSGDISREVENKSTESTKWNQKTVEALRRTQDQTDNFFIEDIARDVPTGTTPARKEFSYPRQFTVTSPHERILQRFRECGRLMENSDEEM